MNPNETEDYQDDSDLGIEDFNEVFARFYGPKNEDISADVTKTALFGPLGTSEGRRHVARGAARAGETLMGLPGDIREAGKALGGYLGEKGRALLGKPTLTDEQRIEIKERLEPSTFDLLGRLTEALPTSQTLKEGVTQRFTGDYLEPENKMEAFGDEVISDFAALAIPIKGKIPFARAIGQSLIANSGSEVANAFAGEKAGAYTKMGLLFTSGLLSGPKGGVKKYISNLYKDMESSIPKGAEISAKNLSSKLDKIEAVLRKGDPKDFSKQQPFQKISSIRDKIKSGNIGVEESVELTKSVNESIYELGDLKRGQNQLYKIREALHDTTKEYGAQNKEFLSQWQAANEAYAATETSRNIGRWVKKNIKPKDYIYAGSAIVGAESVLGAVSGLPAAATSIAGVGALGATAYTAEVMKRISQSPALQKYYLNVVKNAANQNKGAFVRNMKFLDDGLKKSFDDLPYETVEFETVEFED